MQYKTGSKRRSGLAEAGAGSLTQSFVQSQQYQGPYNQLPYSLDPEYPEMPVYSAFKSRKRGDPLQAFHIEMEDRTRHDNYMKRRRTEKAVE
ncbi:unnamed protein product [Sphagnum balticum]